MSGTQDATVSGFYSWTDTLKGVYYGPGSVRTALPKLLKLIGGTKVLIVTGNSLCEKVSVSYKTWCTMNLIRSIDRYNPRNWNNSQRPWCIWSHILWNWAACSGRRHKQWSASLQGRKCWRYRFRRRWFSYWRCKDYDRAFATRDGRGLCEADRYPYHAQRCWVCCTLSNFQLRLELTCLLVCGWI